MLRDSFSNEDLHITIEWKMKGSIDSNFHITYLFWLILFCRDLASDLDKLVLWAPKYFQINWTKYE